MSVLNGIVGDYLHARGNGLAIELCLVHHGEVLPCEAPALRRAHPRATGKVCVLVHGLAENERAWDFAGRPGSTYGTRLAREQGFTPYAVRYNTGRHVSENGEQLARLLDRLVAHHPVKVERLVLIGHSMGGLVARSACQAGAEEGHAWPGLTTDLVCIASPHLGAPLEKLGNVVGWALRRIGHPHTRLAADLLGLRSAGIRDLCFANLVAADWQGADPEALLEDRRIALPSPPGIALRVVAGTLVGDERHPVTWALGDGLVRVPSATGRARRPDPRTRPASASAAVFPGVPHRALAHDARVYRQIAAWCAEGA